MSKSNTNAFAYINKDEFTRFSSSGGAFLGIVSAFFALHKNEKCSVYGSQFNEDLSVSHGRALTFKEAVRFCGSKYVRSDCGKMYTEVQRDLNNGFYVLFSGTPCQVAALRSCLASKEVPDDRLLTVDIVCHGTPKAEFWLDYKRYLEKRENSKLKTYSFRYKPGGWKGYPVYAKFENGKSYVNTFGISRYIALFRKDLLMNNGCFNCQFPGKYQSDITIADFWGIELCMPDVDTKHGVSLMVFHNDNNEKLKEQLRHSSKLMRETKDETYIKYNHNLSKKTKKPENYDDFWRDYKDKGLEYVLKVYGDDNLKGRVKFSINHVIRKTGMLSLAKKIMHKA
ncbi:MAG: Coenzyme F420 hydrogenase/dehydrogenase, beta subunit C-terminal domain [Ruminococcus sp.]|nr:Coenzyme F420 hydrogenase/dehydrogenase, beta subunit C-terminal domain [Ruminococcus sp.]